MIGFAKAFALPETDLQITDKGTTTYPTLGKGNLIFKSSKVPAGRGYV